MSAAEGAPDLGPGHATGWGDRTVLVVVLAQARGVRREKAGSDPGGGVLDCD